MNKNQFFMVIFIILNMNFVLGASHAAFGYKSDLSKVESFINETFNIEIREEGYKSIKLFKSKNRKGMGKFNAYVSGSNYIGEIFLGKRLYYKPLNPLNLLTICHELGHLIGGAPTRVTKGQIIMEQYGVEGQADYFATSKCMKLAISKSLINIDNFDILALDLNIINNCNLSNNSNLDREVCYKVSFVSKLWIKNVFQLTLKHGLASKEEEEFFKTKDPLDIVNLRKTRSTYNDHPELNCRYATFLAGAFCGVSSKTPFSRYDVDQGACVNGIGSRPSCWYAKGSIIIDRK